MSTSAHSATPGPRLSARAVDVWTSDTDLHVLLEDGRGISVPIAWFPRLATATPPQRSNWRLIGQGVGIHWPELDEDISVENLLGTAGDLLMYREVAVPDTMRRQIEALGTQNPRPPTQ